MFPVNYEVPMLHASADLVDFTVCQLFLVPKRLIHPSTSSFYIYANPCAPSLQ